MLPSEPRHVDKGRIAPELRRAATEWNVLARQVVREPHQAVYVPCLKTAARFSEILLLSHGGSILVAEVEASSGRCLTVRA